MPGTVRPPCTDAFTGRDLVLLAAITLAGAALRLALAWERPRLGDEVGTLLNLRMDAGYLLTHFSGWLTMNYFILAEKGVARLTGSEGWPLEILPLLGGVATIPLTASLARRLGGPRLAVLAATLTAFNPYLAQFSPVLRAYAPLAALAVWSADLFFRWRERRTWMRGSVAAGVILLLLLMHPNGIYIVAGLGLLLGIDAVHLLRGPSAAGAHRAILAELATFAVPLAVAGLATWLAYRRLAPDVRTFSVKWGAPPPTGLDYVPQVLATYLGHGFALFLPGGLLLAGFWSATQTRKSLLPLCLLEKKPCARGYLPTNNRLPTGNCSHLPSLTYRLSSSMNRSYFLCTSAFHGLSSGRFGSSPLCVFVSRRFSIGVLVADGNCAAYMFCGLAANPAIWLC